MDDKDFRKLPWPKVVKWSSDSSMDDKDFEQINWGVFGQAMFRFLYGR